MAKHPLGSPDGRPSLASLLDDRLVAASAPSKRGAAAFSAFPSKRPGDTVRGEKDKIVWETPAYRTEARLNGQAPFLAMDKATLLCVRGQKVQALLNALKAKEIPLDETAEAARRMLFETADRIRTSGGTAEEGVLGAFFGDLAAHLAARSPGNGMRSLHLEFDTPADFPAARVLSLPLEQSRYTFRSDAPTVSVEPGPDLPGVEADGRRSFLLGRMMSALGARAWTVAAKSNRPNVPECLPFCLRVNADKAGRLAVFHEVDGRGRWPLALPSRTAHEKVEALVRLRDEVPRLLAAMDGADAAAEFRSLFGIDPI